MGFPILIQPRRGQFAASLVGAPEVRVIGPTRSQAITALTAEIRHRMDAGELVSLEIEAVGVSSLAGSYSDDPTLSEICDRAYETRDAERDS